MEEIYIFRINVLVKLVFIGLERRFNIICIYESI